MGSWYGSWHEKLNPPSRGFNSRAFYAHLRLVCFETVGSIGPYYSRSSSISHSKLEQLVFDAFSDFDVNSADEIALEEHFRSKSMVTSTCKPQKMKESSPVKFERNLSVWFFWKASGGSRIVNQVVFINWTNNDRICRSPLLSCFLRGKTDTKFVSLLPSFPLQKIEK